MIRNNGNPPAPVSKLICAVTYNGAIFLWLFMLLALFQKYFNSGHLFWQSISQHSYSAYIVHILVIFAVVFILRSFPLHHVLKFILAIVFVTLISWGIGYGVKSWPGVRRVLYVVGRKGKTV